MGAERMHAQVVDREHANQQRLRVAVLHELKSRVDQGLQNLADAESILKTETVNLEGDLLGGRKEFIARYARRIELGHALVASELQARLRREPDTIPSFVEEMLRLEAPPPADFQAALEILRGA
mgnify:CR=1 FL=1